MIKIDIHGLKEGEHTFMLSTDIKQEDCFFDEFFGDLTLNGIIKKIGTRLSLRAIAEVKANLICDRSLKTYTELISSEVKLAFIADTKSFLENKTNETDSDIIIREDTNYIDVSKEVIELLALQLPMKRIAPEYRDKELTEIYPELSIDKTSDIDDRWTKLKDFKIN